MQNLNRAYPKPNNRLLFYGVLIFFVFEYFNPGYYFPFLKTLHVGTVVPVFLFAFWLVFGPRTHISVAQSKKLYWLTLLILLSLLWALVTTRAYLSFRFFMGYTLFYLILVHSVSSLDQLKKIFLTLTIIHLTIVFLNIDIFLHATRSGYFNAGFFLGDGNDFSLSLVIMTPIAGALVLVSKSSFLRIFYLGAAIVFLLAIILLESRASSLALASMAIPMIAKSRKKLIPIFLVGVILFSIIVFATGSYLNRIQSISNYQQDTSAMGRIEAWKAGLRMVLRNPQGVGAGNFNSYYGRYLVPIDAPYGNRWISPHSTYIQCLSELGFLGFFIFCSLIFTNFKALNGLLRLSLLSKVEQSSEHRPIVFALLLSLTGYAVNAGFLGTLYYPHIFTLTGLVVIITHLPPQEPISDKAD